MNRKTLLACLIVPALMLFWGCNGDIAKGIIEHHFKSLNAHNAAEVSSDYAADAQVFSLGWEGAKSGPDEVKLAWSRYFHTSPDLKYQITNTIYSGNTAVVEYQSTGTMTNLEPGSPAYMQGKKYTLKNCVVIQVKDSKIINETTYFDQLSFLKQMNFFQHIK